MKYVFAQISSVSQYTKKIIIIVMQALTTSCVCLGKMLHTVPSLTWAPNTRSNKHREGATSVCGRAPAGFLLSAWQTCQCTCWFPGFLCQPQWNLRWVKLAPVQEETWSTTPDTGANWSAIPAGGPAPRRRRWWETRMTNGEKRKEGGGGELLGTKNQSCVTCAIAQRSDPARRRSHCLHNERLHWCLRDCEIFLFQRMFSFSFLHAKPLRRHPSLAPRWKGGGARSRKQGSLLLQGGATAYGVPQAAPFQDDNSRSAPDPLLPPHSPHLLENRGGAELSGFKEPVFRERQRFTSPAY